MTRYAIVAARPSDIGALPAIERAAAQLLVGHAPDSVLNETIGEPVLRDARSQGRLWVALGDDVPVGFALVEVLSEGHAHLEEVDVDPRHGRRGVGAALVKAVLDWAGRFGYEDVTLTTFRIVPWNMPFYSRLGFAEVAADDRTPELETVVRNEATRGLDPVRRVVMRYRVGTVGRGGAAAAPVVGLTAADAALPAAAGGLGIKMKNGEGPILRGRVQSGQGNASHWLRLFNDAYARKIGAPIFPGSLNLAVEEAFDWFEPGLQAGIVPFGREEYGGERDILLLPCVLRSLGNQTALLWTTTASASDPADRFVVQVIAPVGLRATYGLQDGDTVEVELRLESD